MPPERLLRALARRLPAEAGAAIEFMRTQRLPAAAVAEHVDGALAGDPRWLEAVEADRARTARLERAAAIVEAALAGVPGVGVAPPGLGASDVDVFGAPAALDAAGRALEAAGCLPLDHLLARARGGPRHYAVLDGAEVLAAAELSARLWSGGPPAGPPVARRLAPRDAARRRVAKLARERRATVRGVLELQGLVERGELPAGREAAAAVARHAQLERDLIGDDAVLPAEARRAAGAIWLHARAANVTRRAPARLLRRQLRVAFSGVDGSGKSTQVRRLAEQLERAGVPAQASWIRIGNGASRPVTALAALAQRVLPRGTHSFQATREAAGRADPAATAPVRPPLTRRGILGWSWALAVTVDYLFRIRAARHRARGRVLVQDRALPDALVELQDDYGVALRLGFQRRLLERFTPAPHATFHLRLGGAAAKARKDDTFTARELDVQTELYERLLSGRAGVVELDAEAPPDEIGLAVLRALTGPPSRRTTRSRASA